jgi:hypothetical protein
VRVGDLLYSIILQGFLINCVLKQNTYYGKYKLAKQEETTGDTTEQGSQYLLESLWLTGATTKAYTFCKMSFGKQSLRRPRRR